MDTLGDIASSGLTFTISPAQLIIGAGLIGVVFASNAKSILFAWHGRLFAQLARHFYLRRSQLTINSAKHGGESLFAPVVTSSYTPLLDIDYNMHKSNSTFFNDLDDNRTELMLALFKNVVKPEKRDEASIKPKMFNLGGTSCIFKKAIPPFTKYEISSRVLCWDQKWIYVVSHFAKPGSNVPTKYVLGAAKPKKSAKQRNNEDQQDRLYASAITKYVFKQGRITCTPESILLECGLLPISTTTEQLQGLAKGVSNTQHEVAHWSLEQVQEECRSHLEVAQNFGSLDKLHATFVGTSGSAMYVY